MKNLSLKPNVSNPESATIGEIRDVCELILGPNSTSLSSDGKTIYVYYKDEMSYIFSKPSKRWVLHVRASLKPNAVALSVVVFHDNFHFMIGDPFECIGKDTCVYGQAALRYASNRISQVWFGRDDAIFVPSELAEESYPELEFLLTNRGLRNLN